MERGYRSHAGSNNLSWRQARHTMKKNVTKVTLEKHSSAFHFCHQNRLYEAPINKNEIFLALLKRGNRCRSIRERVFSHIFRKIFAPLTVNTCCTSGSVFHCWIFSLIKDASIRHLVCYDTAIPKSSATDPPATSTL